MTYDLVVCNNFASTFPLQSLPLFHIIHDVSADITLCFLQLAVLSTYSDSEVVAVYRYFRSLAVEVPFLTARDNLILQFEKVSDRYKHLSLA